MAINKEEAVLELKEHIRVCYDVCHFAIVYEDPEKVFAAFDAEGIKIGKIQISAALKVKLPHAKEAREAVKQLLMAFEESTDLHQAVARHQEGEFRVYNDLAPALAELLATITCEGG